MARTAAGRRRAPAPATNRERRRYLSVRRRPARLMRSFTHPRHHPVAACVHDVRVVTARLAVAVLKSLTGSTIGSTGTPEVTAEVEPEVFFFGTGPFCF